MASTCPQRKRNLDSPYVVFSLRSATLLALGWLTALPVCAHAAPPDVILRNAEIITMNTDQPSVQAIALASDRIVAPGSDQQIAALADTRTRRVDLRGRTVIPGLTDAHAHAIRGGQTYATETYLCDITALPDAFARVRQAADCDQAQWLAVVGSLHPNHSAEKRPPTMQERTDAVPPELPLPRTGGGVLAPAMLAELALLDRPYMTMPAEDAYEIRAVLTLLGGTAVHDSEGLFAP